MRCSRHCTAFTQQRWGLLFIGLLALALRLLSLLALRRGDLLSLYLGDAASYDAWARALAAGDWVGHTVFYQAPLYPYLLGLVYATLGTDPLIIRLLQALGGSLACVLLALAGERFFDRRSGRVAGLILALYPPAIFFDGLIEKASLATLLVTGMLYSLGRARHDPRARWLLAAGAILGLLALTRENALIFAPVLLAWAIVQRPALPARPGARRYAGAAWLLAGLLAVLLPVAIRNAAAGGEFALTTAQLGPNVYIGNNPRADGTYQPLLAGRGDAAYERADATRLAERALGRELTPGEVSHYWFGQALGFVRAQPLRWLALLGRKAALAVNAVEIVDTEDIYTYAEWSPVLRGLLPVVHFGLLFPLAVAGLIVTWRARRELWLLYALAGAYTLSLVLVYVFARYRFPLVPFLALFAGAACVEGWGWARAPRPARRRLAAAGAVLLAALVANLPILDRRSFHAPALCNVAYALIEQRGEPERALPYVQRAIEQSPGYANAHQLMGVILAARGDLRAAESELRRAISLEPDRALTYTQLADALAAQGRLEEAVEAHRQALRLDPADVVTLNNLAGALAGLQRYDEALRCLEQAAALLPDPHDIRVNYAMLLAQAGRVEQARALLTTLLRERPDDARARRVLASLDSMPGAEAGKPRER
jgi:Tfp pilus assembly protein PilF